MKKTLLCLLLIISLLFCFVGCKNKYSPDSKSKTFELSNVSSVTLSGPSSVSSEGITVEIAPGKGNYTKLVELVQGERLMACPTQNFGFCIITYNINTEETVKVYPANDGSNYVCLYSLNPTDAQYLELPEASMKELCSILESNGIQVVYET